MKDIRTIFNIEKRSKLGVILTIIIFSLLSSVITGLVFYFISGKSLILSEDELELLETFSKIKSSYYKDIDMDKVKMAAINGMIEYLGEDYTEILNSGATDKLNDKLSGKYKGIGISINFNGENAFILSVQEDTPAKKAGLEEGDIIISINGTKITIDNYNEISNLVKDKDTLDIEIKRENEVFKKSIDTKNIIKPSVTSNIFKANDKTIGYIYIETFSLTTNTQVKNHVDALESKGIDSLIIDVRSNTGGYLDIAEDIASMFINEGKVLYKLETKNTVTEVLDETKEARSYDIAVLINEVSASASEILALSLKESYGAILIGTKSYGKGRVQKLDTISGDENFKMTVANWLSPNGNSIDSVGITPGIYVPLSKNYANNPSNETDDQLIKAIEVLSN